MKNNLLNVKIKYGRAKAIFIIVALVFSFFLLMNNGFYI